MNEIVQRGKDAIAEVERKLSELDQQIASTQSQIDQFQKAQSEHRKQIEEAQIRVQKLKSGHDQALAYAKLAHDTPQSAGAIKALSSAKKELTTAQKHLADLEKAQPDGRDQELISTLQGLRLEREKLQSELAHTRAAHAQSFHVLGERKRDSLIQTYQEHSTRVDILRRQLVEAQVDLYNVHQNALEELNEWTDLQREVRNLQPVDDHMSRVLEATLMYIDTLISDADHLTGDFPGIPWSLWETIFIPVGQVRGAPGQLQERQRRVRQILDAYKKHCNG